MFLEQLGMPLPAMPTLIVAGALTRQGRMSSTHRLIAAVVASPMADYVWAASAWGNCQATSPSAAAAFRR